MDPLIPYLECRRSANSGRHYRLHLHESLSIGAIDAGEVDFRVGEEVGRLVPGELILINPDTPHYCNPSGPAERNYYVLYLDKAWCAEIQKALWSLEGFQPLRACHLRDRGAFDRFLLAMELLLGRGEAIEKEEAVLELVQGLFVLAQGPAEPRAPCRFDLDGAKSLLGDELGRNLSLSEAAAAFGANPFAFLRRFRAEFGITPFAYRMNRRIELAKELLRGGADLGSIALDCGFYDQSHFTRHFKALTASTPGEYRVNFVQDRRPDP